MNVHFKNIKPAVSSVFIKRPVQVLVFKTNLRFKKDLRQIEPLMNTQPGIMCWNVDREDTDHVLRIETMHLQAQDIIRLMNHAGYFCEELPD
jgi:hypothetical protein